MKPQPKEAVVFYLHMPAEKNLPEKIASVQPLDIQFQKIGSTDDNGQASIIIPKLKTLVEGRSKAAPYRWPATRTRWAATSSISISRKNARKNIAQKIKAAFSSER